MGLVERCEINYESWISLRSIQATSCSQAISYSQTFPSLLNPGRITSILFITLRVIMARERFELVLKSAQLIAPQVRELQFIRANNDPFEFIAGQFINLHFHLHEQEIQRSYSIASIHGQNSTIDITIAYVNQGKATEFLFNLQPGEQVAASGPFGRLILKEEQPRRYVLIATGTGVAPYRSMLNALKQHLANNLELEIVLLLGVRNQAECLYRDDFVAFSQEHPRFHFYACYSQELPNNPQPFEHKGRVLAQFDALNLIPANDIVYLCGNPMMIDDAFAYLKERGFDNSNVRREKYVFSH